jgi:hypothetical protein
MSSELQYFSVYENIYIYNIGIYRYIKIKYIVSVSILAQLVLATCKDIRYRILHRSMSIRHVVFFGIEPGTSLEDIKKVEDDWLALKQKIPTIMQVTTDLGEYLGHRSLALTATFVTIPDYQEYQFHDELAKVINELSTPMMEPDTWSSEKYEATLWEVQNLTGRTWSEGNWPTDEDWANGDVGGITDNPQDAEIDWRL